MEEAEEEEAGALEAEAKASRATSKAEEAPAAARSRQSRARCWSASMVACGKVHLSLSPSTGRGCEPIRSDLVPGTTRDRPYPPPAALTLHWGRSWKKRTKALSGGGSAE